MEHMTFERMLRTAFGETWGELSRQLPEFIPRAGNYLNLRTEISIDAVQTYPSTSLVSFYSVSTDSSGKYVAAVNYGGVFYSSNYGQSYSVNNTVNNNNFGYAAIASTAPDFVAAAGSDGVYRSSNSAMTFERVPGSSDQQFSKVVLSSDGHYSYALLHQSGSSIYGSNDYLGSISALSGSILDYYNDIATTATGQYIYAVSSSVYVSNDFGANWQKPLLPASVTSYSPIGCSTTSGYVAVFGYGNTVILSTDYGITWITRTLPLETTWDGITMSSTGQYLALTNYGHSVFISNDYGNTFFETPSSSQDYWNSISMSSSGSYIYAASGDGSIYSTADAGTIWSPNYYGWTGIASSQTGQYMVAVIGAGEEGAVFVSNNYGSNWIQVRYDTNSYFNAVSCDSICQHIIVAPGNTNYALLSSDRGSSWSSSTPILPDEQSMTNVAMSGTGQYIVVSSISTYEYTASGTIYVSNDFGASWQQGPTPSYTFTALTVSMNGEYMRAIPTRVGTTGFYSEDFGKTWISQTIPSSFAAFAANSTGQFLVGCNFKTIYVSNNAGKTWTTKTVSTLVGCSDISTSSSGDSIYVTFSSSSPVSGMMARSTDFGHTWVTVPGTTSLGYSSISCDEKCYNIATAVNQGAMFVSSDSGNSWKSVANAVITIPTTSSDEKSSPWSAGVIAGIVIGGVVFVALITAGIAWLMGCFSLSKSALSASSTSQPRASKDQVEIVNPISQTDKESSNLLPK